MRCNMEGPEEPMDDGRRRSLVTRLSIYARLTCAMARCCNSLRMGISDSGNLIDGTPVLLYSSAHSIRGRSSQLLISINSIADFKSTVNAWEDISGGNSMIVSSFEGQQSFLYNSRMCSGIARIVTAGASGEIH